MSELDETLSKARRITERVILETGAARRSWALFEALNGESDTEREPMRKAITRLGLGLALNGVAMALVRDTIATLFRLTDASKTDRLTVCRISHLLSDSSLVDRLVEDARNWIPDSPKEFSDADGERCAEAISSIQSLCPPIWDKDNLPTDPRLFDLREKLRPVRDRLLSHSMDTGQVTMPVRDEVSDFLAIVSDVADSARLVFLGAAGSGKDDFDGRYREATELWDYLQSGLVETNAQLGRND